MAGIAEKCLHVAALLYKIDTAVQLRGHLTPTHVSAYWVEPSNVKKVNGAPGHTIVCSTGAAHKKALDRATSGHSSTTRGIRTRSLLCLRNPEMDGELSVLLQHCESLRPLVAVTETQATSLERQTREQHKSALWRTARAGRITASNIHSVVSTPLSSPALSTVKKVCYPHKPSYTGNRKQDDEQLTPMEWGRAKEDTARELYRRKQELQYEDLKVEKCGFIVNPSFPELGASPDALVDCVCCGKGCVEIKCPHKHRDHTISQACADKDFCLEFTSVQTQIFVAEIVQVTPDAEFWETTLLPKAQTFFYKVHTFICAGILLSNLNSGLRTAAFQAILRLLVISRTRGSTSSRFHDGRL
uniref:YqaJ viral recombinase domain-containing protein n=1 Tax=Dicentrarchus labrax TaxID=13489 RepID=A0A8P4G0Z6_DICLA